MKLFHDFAANFIQRKRRAAKKQFEVLERSLLVSYPVEAEFVEFLAARLSSFFEVVDESLNSRYRYLEMVSFCRSLSVGASLSILTIDLEAFVCGTQSSSVILRRHDISDLRLVVLVEHAADALNRSVLESKRLLHLMFIHCSAEEDDCFRLLPR